MKKKSSNKPEAPRPTNTIKSFFTSSAPKPIFNNSLNSETKTNETIIENDNNNVIKIDETPEKDNSIKTSIIDLIEDDDLISPSQNQINNFKDISFQSRISSQDTKTSSTQYVPSETPINTSSSPIAVADKPSPPIHPLFAGKATTNKPVQPSSTTTTVPTTVNTTTTTVKAKTDKSSKNTTKKESSSSIKPLLFAPPVHSIDQSPSIDIASPDPSPNLLTSPPSNNQHTEPIDLITSDLTAPNTDPIEVPDSPTPAAEPDVVAVPSGGRPRRQAVLNTLARAAQIHAAAVSDDLGTYTL